MDGRYGGGKKGACCRHRRYYRILWRGNGKYQADGRYPYEGLCESAPCHNYEAGKQVGRAADPCRCKRQCL